MKLSEAILKGCELTKPHVGDYFHGGSEEVCACAMGAAAVGFNPAILEPNADKYETLNELLQTFSDTLYKVTFVNPVSKRNQDGLAIIVNLNDFYEWPREKIANWLAEQGH